MVASMVASIVVMTVYHLVIGMVYVEDVEIQDAECRNLYGM